MTAELPTIADAANQIREGKLAPRDLLEQCLANIRRLEDKIRAWVVVDEQGAGRQADQLEKDIAAGKTEGRLLGAVIGVKDIIDVEGFPTRAGSPLRENHVAERDAPLVAALRSEGAIILGKTVTTEFACFDPSPTRNPWNLEHTPGGSSSGSAAAVAAQMCMAAIGSQTGGSITRPASFCGVAGLKPTFGRVSTQGVVPVSMHLDHVGPIARNCADLHDVWMALQKTTTDTVLEEPIPGPLELYDLLRETGSRAQKLFILGRPTEFFWERADDSVREATDAALDILQQAGAKLKNVNLPASFGQVHQMHRRIMAAEASEVHRADFSRAPQKFGPHIAALIEEGLRVTESEHAEALNHQREFSADIEKCFGDHSLGAVFLITPSTVTAAPSLDTTGDPSFNSPWSYCGLPTVTIPCGLTNRGLPCGLQLICARNLEIFLLMAAARIEQFLGRKLFTGLA